MEEEEAKEKRAGNVWWRRKGESKEGEESVLTGAGRRQGSEGKGGIGQIVYFEGRKEAERNGGGKEEKKACWQVWKEAGK